MRSALPLTMAYLLPVLLFVLSFWSSSSLDNGGGRKTVIARPFTAHDVQKLAESFELWPDPCGETRGDVDLYLVFSRNLEDAKKTNDVVQNILEAHTAPWRKCFREVTALSAGIHPEDDIYNPALQDTNVKWVNGPNRQFERTFRMLQQKEYEVMYLMESDSVPLKENWLSMLVQEMENLAPFSVMGRYVDRCKRIALIHNLLTTTNRLSQFIQRRQVGSIHHSNPEIAPTPHQWKRRVQLDRSHPRQDRRSTRRRSQHHWQRHPVRLSHCSDSSRSERRRIDRFHVLPRYPSS